MRQMSDYEPLPTPDQEALPDDVGALPPTYEGVVGTKPEIWEFKSEATRDKAVTELKRQGFQVTVGSTLTVADPGNRGPDVTTTVKKLDRYAARMRHDT